jgi:hypothetical protein
MPKEGAPIYEPVRETPLPADLFGKSLVDDFDGDSSEYARDVAGKAEPFLDSAADEEEWQARLERVTAEINERVGGYEAGVAAERALLAEILRRKMFPQKP